MKVTRWICARLATGPSPRRGAARVARATLALGAVAVLVQPGPAVAAPTANGRVVYSVNATTPQHRAYAAATNAFSAAASAVAGAGNQRFFVDRAAPTRDEHIAGYVTSTGVLYVLRWNGSAWSAEWNVTVGGDGVTGRRFDIAYETTGGRAIVVYSNNSTGTNELRYRIWDGAAWTGATNLNSNALTGTPIYVKMAVRRTAGSDEITAAIADTNSRLTALTWNGTGWGSEPAVLSTNLQRNTSAGDRDVFDVAYESASGGAFLVYSENTPEQYHRTFSGGTWSGASSWGTGRAVVSMFATADLDPASDRIVTGFARTANSSVYAAVWSGTALSSVTAVGSTHQTGISLNASDSNGAFVRSGTTTAAVVVWSSTTNSRIDYAYTTDGGGNWTGGTSNIATVGGTWRWIAMEQDFRGLDTAMLTFSDSGNDLWAKRLVFTAPSTLTWTQSDGGTALTTGLASSTSQNFGFAYDRFVPTVDVGNGTDPAGSAITVGGVAPLDAFTVRTNVGNATVTSVTVNIPANAAALSGVFVSSASDCGGTPLGSLGAAPVNGDNAIALATSIGATPTSGGTSYWVCVTAAAVGTSADVTGTVSAVSATGYASSDGDTTGATVTVMPRIDIGNGADPGASTISAGQTAAMDAFTLATTGGTATVTAVTVSVAGSASALADLSLNDAPGCTGTTWGSLGAAPVAGANAISIPTGMTVTPATSASYYVCATAAVVGASADVTGTVSAVTAAGYGFLDGDTSGATVTVTVPPSLVIGEGSDPAPASITKDGVAALDAFTLQTSAGTATVTAVTVNVPSNAAALSNLSIRALASCGGASYGALGGPPSDGDNTIPLGPSLSATPGSGATSYYVCATAAAVGVDTPVTGNVSSVSAAGFAPVDADGSGPTITVTPAPDVIVGDPGSEPPNVSLGFGGVAALDAFTLRVASGTAQVTAVTVALTNGTALFSLSIGADSSCAGARLGYLEGVAAGTNLIPLGTVLDVGTVAATYYVCLTGGSVASSTAVTGTVASVTAFGHDSVDGDAQSATITVQPTVPAGSTNTAAPMISIVNPADGAVVSSATSYKVQIRVFNAAAQGGIAGLVGSVALSTDGGATFPRPATRNAAYDSGTTGATYEVTIPGPANGTYVLRARVSNGAVANVLSEPIVVRSIGARGDGKLLLRDNANQLCSDCHAIRGHSSESVGTKYGSWAVACRDCHAPHGTRNVKLVRESIRPPSVTGGQVPRNVGFVKGTGDSGAAGWDAANARPTGTGSFANADGTGPCQVCHTRTQGPGAVARWRNTGNADTHYTAGAGTQACTDCHIHGKGFGGGESEGGGNCSGCHKATWEAATGAAAGIVARHALGSVRGTNDAFADSGLGWGSVASLSDNAPSQRSCVNMCHQDHVHNQPPAGTTHDHNVHADASTGATRAVTRGTGGTITAGTPARTDFAPGAAPNGLCVSCHQKPVAAGRTPISGASFDASAHDFTGNTVGGSTYTWRYTLHDGSTFDRNCTKCHASRTEGTTPASGGTITAVHGTPDPTLLAGTRNPAGTPAGFVCYNCHGSAATPAAGQQGDRSGKDIQTQVAKASNHPANDDAAHSGAEREAASFGNALGGAARHASCMDCHDPHGARAGTHAVTTNVAGPPLEGAWGAALTTPPAFWTAPTAGSFTKKTIVAGTDPEATLCFKCHSSFYGALPTSPSGGYTETDTAREFNPNNAGNWYTAGTTTSWASGETAGGFHPVLADAGNNLGRVNMANLVTTNFAWRTSGARNLMTCTDCHESNGVADPNGPHGSTAGFILRGPNTLWNATLVASSSSMPAGTFCANCHSSTWSGSRFATNQHTNRTDHRVSCWNCHARIPHGGPRPGILVASAGAAAGVGGVIAGWDQTAPYWGLGTSADKLYIASYPTSPTGQWSQNNCGCNGTGH